MYSRDSDAPRPRSLTRTRHDRDGARRTGLRTRRPGLDHVRGDRAGRPFRASRLRALGAPPAPAVAAAKGARSGPLKAGRSKQAAQQRLVEDVAEAGAVAVAAQLDAHRRAVRAVLRTWDVAN